MVCRAYARRVVSCGAVVLSTTVTVEVHAQAITPVFAWPAGASATMTTEMTAEGYPAEAAAAMPRKMVTSYAVSAHAEGLRITSQMISMEPVLPKSQTAGLDLEALTRRRSAFIVQKTGAFVRLDDTLSINQYADSMASNITASITARAGGMASPAMDAIIARSQEQMRATLSVANLTEQSRRMWELQTAALTHRAWRVGDSATFAAPPVPTSATSAFSGAGMYPQMLRFDGEVACPIAAVTRCWQFTARSGTSSALMRAVMRVQMRQAMADMPGADDPEVLAHAMSMLDTMPVLEMVNTSESIVDAATLLPLRTTAMLRSSSGRANVPPAAARTVVTYDWKRP